MSLIYRMCIVLCTALWSACGLPADDLKRAEDVLAQIDQGDVFIAQRDSTYRVFQGTEEYEAFARYAEREGWDAAFDEARTTQQRARRMYTDNVTPVLERNSSDTTEVNLLRTELDRVESALADARDAARRTRLRITFLREVRDNAPQFIIQAELEYAWIDSLFDTLTAFTRTARSDFRDRTADIDTLFTPLVQIHRDSEEAFSNSRREYRRIGSRSDAPPDYAILGDSCERITQNTVVMQERAPTYRNKIRELYRSYSKVLIDMRAEYLVQAGRTTWDNYYDYPTEHNHIYFASEVDLPTFEYFDGLADNVVLAVSGTHGRGLSVQIDRNRWEQLGIDLAENWTRGDDGAEWWLNMDSVRYYHRYELIENGAQTETDWERVTEEEYNAQWENLGMTVATKPYGMFEDEVLTQATPPGLAYVGNSQYGSWQNEPGTGNRFWVWYAQYRFMSALMGFGRPYYYSTWDTWRNDYRGQRPYYGSPDSDGRPGYGTNSRNVETGSRYSGSTFARRGGFTEAQTLRTSGSVRGAGASARGGGPGGRGK